MKSVFSKLDPKIQEILINNGIKKPTEPQTKAIPQILKGENILLIAPTGMGKTESAILPIFHNFLNFKKHEKSDEEKGISILYITPLRALNRDMLRRTLEWGKFLEINIAVRHGDTTQTERARQSKNPPDMLITTPETFQIMFTGKRLKNHLRKIKHVIIDEIHELANDERGAQLSVALERLYELTKKKIHEFQRIGLSATVGSPEEVKRFLGGFKDGTPRFVTVLEIDVTKHLDIKVEKPVIKKSDYADANNLQIEPIYFASLKRAYELISRHTSTLFFVNTRDGAEILASRFHLWKENLKIGVHHGSLSKIARIESENDFKNGYLKSLICTSSLELGIDVGDTDLVIQYNSPREVQRIVQRIGRSGHKIGKTSKGVIIANTPEEVCESAVIARKTINGEIECLKVRQNPLSVLTNQIISIVLEYREIKPEKIYSIITRSYPFFNLDRLIFDKIVEQLCVQRNIWMENNIVYNRRNSRSYFLENISMIPDEKSFVVIDISSRRKIGKLDESFVINYGFEGAKFILRGKPWIIVKREENEILVSHSKEIGTIPSWIGEDIPIPFEVALEVGRLRRYIASKGFVEDYPWNKSSFEFVRKQIENQKRQGFIVPDDKNVTIEIDDKTLVINACFGTKVNQTLGRLISALLAQSIGESIGINSDAYRVNLELPFRIKPDKIKDILYTIKPESIFYIICMILKNSAHIRWQLVHVARKFGAIRKDFDFKNVGSKKLFTLFENSLILEEALDKTIWERMDIENTMRVLEEIQKGDILVHIQLLSPIAYAGIESIRGLMAPLRADRTILKALKKRLEDSDITLVCTNCYNSWDTKVTRIKDKPKCIRCGAIKIAVFRRYNKDMAKILKRKDRTNEEIREISRIHKNASLVLSYGYFAVLALVGRGIGPDTAARILRRYNKSSLSKIDELMFKFLRDILKAELNYARTRGFWDK